jgi:V/A-type H+-transporting ATPase subunit I
MLRPASTRWFEVLCPRAESVRTVAALARTRSIEIEVRERAPSELPVLHLAEDLSAYQALAQRYGRYWARGRLFHRVLAEPPSVVLRRALHLIAAWRREADPLIDILQEGEEELTRLKWLAQIIEKIAESPLDFGAVARSGPVLGTFCAILPRDAKLALPDWALPRSVPWELERCYMFLGPRDRLAKRKMGGRRKK